MDKGLTKKDTKAIKGIVIIMMLFHHMFRVPIIYKDFSPNFFPFTEIRVNDITTFFKLCVGTFAFLSGFGLAKSWENRNKRGDNLSNFWVKRYWKTFISYWIIFFGSCIVCQILDGLAISTYFSDGFSINNFTGFLISFLGLSRLFGTGQLCNEWWYHLLLFCC